MIPACSRLLFILLIVSVSLTLCTLSSDQLFVESHESLDLPTNSPSVYHRKLLQATKPEPPVPTMLTNAQQRAMWPSWWNDDLEKRLQDEVLIGIVTTRSMHSRLAYQRATWWYEERTHMAEVYTDVTHDPTVPNVVYTHCDSSYYYGLWCKNKHMLQMWASPRYQKYKWFIRANDDSYYHLENIYEHLSKLNHTESLVIGSVLCWHKPNFDYPGGGSGFILSRGFVDSLNWTIWDNPTSSKMPIQLLFEDVLWGKYMKEEGNGKLIHSPGIAQGGIQLNSQVFKAFLTYRNRSWPFPFRPMAYHLAHYWQHMPTLHAHFHSLEYTPPSKYIWDIPDCKCRPGAHSACSWNASGITHGARCQWKPALNACLGPHKDYSYTGYLAYEKAMDAKSGQSKT